MYRTDIGAGESRPSPLLHRAPAVKQAPVPSTAAGRSLKRAMDIGAALTFFVLFFWLFAALWVAVRLTTGSPVIYAHERIGFNGRKFRCLKFRSMVRDSDRVLSEFLDSSPAARDEWSRTFKLKSDPRITWFGRFIRKTSLDELPQFWNVLRGEMSMVGPRPVTKAELDTYYGPSAAQYMRARPGLTGLWQIGSRHEESYESRVALDVHYVNNWSFRRDIVILWKTLRVVLTGQGAS